jgi:hypothetical protein
MFGLLSSAVNVQQSFKPVACNGEAMAENHYFVYYCPLCSNIYYNDKWIKAKDSKPFLLDLLDSVEAVIFIKEICIDCYKQT